MFQLASRVLLLVLLTMTAGFGAGVVAAQTSSDMTSGMTERKRMTPALEGPAGAAARVEKSSRASKDGNSGGSKASEDPLAVAYQCLSNLALHARKTEGALDRARNAADVLLTRLTADERNRRGWSYVNAETAATKKCNRAGSIDPFGDGTCNPPGTPYMIQTGYAVACLAQAGIATGDSRYVEGAKKAVGDSWEMGATPGRCRDCFYYWYSYHPHDVGRYVRNTNLIMGLGVAWLYGATGDEIYRKRAQAIARAEHREIQAGNFGYFGIDDPRYIADPRAESERIENHIPHQVQALKDMSTLLGDRQARADARVMLDAFLNCKSGRCRPDNCKAWAAPVACKATATIAPCILADEGEPYASRCRDVERAVPRLNQFQTFLRHAPADPRSLK